MQNKTARNCRYTPIRTVDDAIEEKLRVLSDFLIVNPDNKESFREMMKSAVAERPGVHFDRVLDTFAAKQFNARFS